MKIVQEPGKFQPVAIVIETREELQALWNLVLYFDQHNDHRNEEQRILATRISDFFSNEAKL